MFKLVGKAINVILCAQTILIWTYDLHCAHHLIKVDISSKSDKGFRSGAVKNSIHVTFDLHYYLNLEAGCLKLLILSHRGEHLCEIFKELDKEFRRYGEDTNYVHVTFDLFLGP